MMIKRILKQTSVVILLILILSGCSKDLKDLPNSQEVETINGFDVKWRKQITEAQKEAVKYILNDLIYVKGGYFMMGATDEQVADARNNEFPVHYVKLSDYYIGAHEVSHQHVKMLMTGENNDEYFSKYWSYDEWLYFISLLNEITSLKFDLPTEAQWEYAARGGQQSMGYKYPGSNYLEEVWTAEKEISNSKPNELGIYNMADLYSEWCKDAYGSYDSESVLLYDPCVIVGEGHVVRGGNYESSEQKSYYSVKSYNFYEKDKRMCRISARSPYAYSSDNISCRLVINIK